MNKAKSAMQVLQAVEWILVNKGWCQGSYYQDSNGNPLHLLTTENLSTIASACLEGAIDLVDVRNISISDKAEEILESVVGNNITVYNDAPSRTKKQVLAAVRKAINKADK